MPLHLKAEGHYTYTGLIRFFTSDNGKMTFDMTVQDDGSLYGSGTDNVGQFTVSGTLKGSKLDFQKDYTGQNLHWIYAGHQLKSDSDSSTQRHFHGKWHPPGRPTAPGGEFDFKADVTYKS